MKILKHLPLFLILVLYSCSNSDDSKEEQQEEDGTISITFSDGRSFSLDEVIGTFDDYYDVSEQQLEFKIIATSSDPSISGTLTITITDNEVETQSFVSGASIPVAATEAESYVTINYIDNNSTYNGLTGTMNITNLVYNSSVTPENISFSGTIDTSNGSGLTLIGSILDIVMFCNGAECGG